MGPKPRTVLTIASELASTGALAGMGRLKGLVGAEGRQHASGQLPAANGGAQEWPGRPEIRALGSICRYVPVDVLDVVCVVVVVVDVPGVVETTSVACLP